MHTQTHTHIFDSREATQTAKGLVCRVQDFGIQCESEEVQVLFCFVFKQKRKYFVKSFINHTSDTVLVCSRHTSKTFKTNEKNFLYDFIKTEVPFFHDTSLA